VLTVLGITFGALFLLSLGYLAWQGITWLLIAAFFAMALNPAVEVVERRGIGRGIAATLVFLAVLIVVTGVGVLVGPPLVRALTSFVDGLPQFLHELERGRGPLGFLEQRFSLGDRAQRAFEEGGAVALLGLERPGAGAVRSAAGTALTAIAIPFLTFFMLLDGRRWVAGLLGALSPSSRPRWARVCTGIYRTVGGYVTGNLLISVIAAVTAGVTLFAVGVPYALPIALLVGVLDLIPLLGAILATAVAGAFALTEGVVPALIVVTVLIVYQQIENHVLQPMIYGRFVTLSPLAVLVSVLIGTQLAGVLGALAAIPIGGSVAVIATEILRWRRETMLELPVGTAEQLREDE
jgi:predicted PurR-regulated permease PerM